MKIKLKIKTDGELSIFYLSLGAGIFFFVIMSIDLISNFKWMDLLGYFIPIIFFILAHSVKKRIVDNFYYDEIECESFEVIEE